MGEAWQVMLWNARRSQVQAFSSGEDIGQPGQACRQMDPVAIGGEQHSKLCFQRQRPCTHVSNDLG